MLLRSAIRSFLSRSTANSYKLSRFVPICQKSTEVKSLDETDAPVPYSTSPASKWKAQYSRTGRSVERLWYEPFVVVGSLAVFMVYFFILREENDIDVDLSKSLYSRIEGLERKQLEITLDYNKQNGLETKAIVERLAQLDVIENAEKNK